MTRHLITVLRGLVEGGGWADNDFVFVETDLNEKMLSEDKKVYI